MGRFVALPELVAVLMVAACSQVQTPIMPTPQPPTVVSTDFADRAVDVATDTEGNAYVVGYRNVSYDSVTGLLGDIFISRFDISGSLRWLTRLDGVAKFNNVYSEAAITKNAVYVLAMTDNRAGPFMLYKLSLEGDLLLSKALFGVGDFFQDFAVTPDDQLYLSRKTADEKSVIGALDSSGTPKWEVVTSSDSGDIMAASDGSLYEAGDYRVSKRALDGKLIWTKLITPSLPYNVDESLEGTALYLSSEGIYAVATFLEQNRFLNKEITHFDSSGRKVWSRLIIPSDEPVPDCDLPTLHCIGVLGVSADGVFYASRGNVLVRLSATGERLETDGLKWFGDYPEARALTHATLPEIGAADILYEVGITGIDEANACDNYWENTEVKVDCAPTDSYVQQFRLVPTYAEDGTLAATYTGLTWSSR